MPVQILTSDEVIDLTLDTETSLTLCLPDSGPVIYATGRVCWHRDREALSTSSRPLTGLSFNALKPDELMRLLARFKQHPTTLTGHH